MSEDVKGDEAEAQEWLDALDSVEAFEGLERVDALLESVVTSARRKGAKLPFAANTAYVNTIHPDEQVRAHLAFNDLGALRRGRSVFAERQLRRLCRHRSMPETPLRLASEARQ